MTAAGHAASSTDLAGEQVVEISWNAVPFRAERFEEIWRPIVEMSLEFGARWYAFYRAQGDPWLFRQVMAFDEKLDFERYWYSDLVADARMRASGLFQIPLLPDWHHVVTRGERRASAVGG